MLKSFKECLGVSLDTHIQKKPTFYQDKVSKKFIKTAPDKWLDYVEWAVILKLLYTECGAESVSFSSSFAPEKKETLRINVCIDGQDFQTDYPLIDGSTLLSNPDQLKLHKAELRGFVKCVAISTGLGLGLWMNDENNIELPPDPVKEPEEVDELTMTLILAVTDRDELIKAATEIAPRASSEQKNRLRAAVRNLED